MNTGIIIKVDQKCRKTVISGAVQVPGVRKRLKTNVTDTLVSKDSHEPKGGI